MASCSWCRPGRERQVDKTEGIAPMSEIEERNRALARSFLEAQANADLDTREELLAPDFVDHNLQPDQEPGREGFIRSVAEEPAIFSKVRINIEDQAADRDKVITRLTYSRLHDRGEFLGSAYRSGDQDECYRHPPNSGRQDRRGVEREYGCSGGNTPASRARDTRARARRAGDEDGQRHPTSLAAQGGAHPRGLGGLPTLPTC